MPRESGASSNHRVMRCAPAGITGLLDRPLSRAMTRFLKHLLLDGAEDIDARRLRRRGPRVSLRSTRATALQRQLAKHLKNG